MAAIEYNYERDGEIIIPAGAKALGELQQANRNGNIGIHFHTLQMPDGTTEKVRNAIAYTLTGGKMGERQDDDLISEVTAAQSSTDMDLKRLGMATWCETQKPKLAGFIRTQN